jgi:hypothetical protein
LGGIDGRYHIIDVASNESFFVEGRGGLKLGWKDIGVMVVSLMLKREGDTQLRFALYLKRNLELYVSMPSAEVWEQSGLHSYPLLAN